MATPLVAVADVKLVMTGFGGLTVRVSVARPVPFALVAPRVTDETPVVVGVPEIIPDVESTLSPAGSPVAAKLVGLLLAAIV